MAKSISEWTEEIYRSCDPPKQLNEEAEARSREYIRCHLEAIERQAVSIVDVVDDQFLRKMGLSADHGRAFLEKVNSELGKITRSDIGSKTI
jgi:hypothetical protein